MTQVVGKLVEFGFNEWGLRRITANIFATNKSSKRCIEKNRFKYEGLLRNYYLKDGKLIDANLFAITPEDLK